VFHVDCVQVHAGGTRVRPQHPSVGSSGVGTSCSPSPPKSILSQSAPSDVNAYTFLRCDISTADDSVGNVQVIRWFCSMISIRSGVNFSLDTIFRSPDTVAPGSLMFYC